MSNVPRIIDALISTFTAAAPDVLIVDGPPLQAPNVPAFVAIGWSPLASHAASAPQHIGGIGPGVRDELWEVFCYLSVFTGDTDIKGRRDDAFTLFATLGAAVKADPSLGGIIPVGWAIIGDVTLIQDQTQTGANVGIAFTVTGQART